VAEQIGHLYGEIQVEALAGQDIREKQQTLKRAEKELARLHAARAETVVSARSGFGAPWRDTTWWLTWCGAPRTP
jgi:hypothetical protein